MMGSKALSSSWPASAAMVTVTSFPMMLKATWLTTSGMTGLTFPGMMEEPFCRGGRLISLKPQRGPEDMSRRSLDILDRLTAQVLTAPDTATSPSRFWVASMRSKACTSSSPVTLDRLGMMRRRYRSSALMPVPMAVPPMLRRRISSLARSKRAMSRCTTRL